MSKTRNITNISIFGAIIVVLQLIASYINFGSFPITLTLIPIVIGGAMYGVWFSTVLGFIFSCVVLFVVLIGGDPNSAIMLMQHPFITILLIYTKGCLTGLISGIVFKILEKRNTKIALICSGLIAPIVNTGVFTIFLLLFFDSNIKVLIGLFLSINFVVELLINGLLSPGLYVLINKTRF